MNWRAAPFFLSCSWQKAENGTGKARNRSGSQHKTMSPNSRYNQTPPLAKSSHLSIRLGRSMYLLQSLSDYCCTYSWQSHPFRHIHQKTLTWVQKNLSRQCAQLKHDQHGKKILFPVFLSYTHLVLKPFSKPLCTDLFHYRKDVAQHDKNLLTCCATRFCELKMKTSTDG